MADTSPPEEAEEVHNSPQAVGEVNRLPKAEEEESPPEEVGEGIHFPWCCPSLEAAYRRNSFLDRNWGEGPRREEDQRRTFLRKALGVGRAVGRLVGLVEGVRLVVALPRALLVSARC